MAYSTETAPSSSTELDILQPGPETRVRNVVSALSLYNTLWEDGRERRLKRGRIRNQTEGGRPWDPKILKRIGRADATNHNFRDAEASAERALAPYYEMANSVPNKASFDIQEDYPNKEMDEMSMADAFDLYLADEGMDYVIKFLKLAQEYVRFGPGMVIWEDQDSPRWKPLKVNDVHMPKETPIESDEWEMVMVDDNKGIGYLYAKTQDETNAREAGWNIDQVKRVLTKVGDGVLGESIRNRRLDDWDFIQDEIKNNDITATNTWPNVPLVHMFTKEKNGKISHKIFIRDGIASLGKNERGTEAQGDTHAANKGVTEREANSANKEEDLAELEEESLITEEFIYENLNSADKMNQKIGSLFAEVANGMVHGVNGFGQKNYSHGVLINRIKCRLVDSLNFSTSMNFQRPAEYSDDTPPIQSFGSVNLFAPNIKQLQYQPKLGESLSVLSMLENNMDSNNALFREGAKQISQTETATAAKLLGNIQAEASQSASALFLVQWGSILSEQVRRLRKKGSDDPDAKKFVKRCKARKIPDKVIHDSDIIVGSGATASTASPIARAILWEEMRAAARTTPGANVRWIDRMYFANKLGSNAVKKVLPADPAMTQAAIISDSIIQNSVMGTGLPLPVDAMDDHVVHLDEHMKPLEGISNAALQGGEIKPDALIAVQVISQHIEEHLQKLSEDTVRRSEFKELNKRYNLLKQALTQVIQMAMAANQKNQENN